MTSKMKMWILMMVWMMRRNSPTKQQPFLKGRLLSYLSYKSEMQAQ